MKIENGTVIHIQSKKEYWVCIHKSRCELKRRKRMSKFSKNHTEFYLFAGLWYEGDVLSDKPYGKCLEILERGMFPDMEIIGEIVTESVKALFTIKD